MMSETLNFLAANEEIFKNIVLTMLLFSFPGIGLVIYLNTEALFGPPEKKKGSKPA